MPGEDDEAKPLFASSFIPRPHSLRLFPSYALTRSVIHPLLEQLPVPLPSRFLLISRDPTIRVSIEFARQESFQALNRFKILIVLSLQSELVLIEVYWTTAGQVLMVPRIVQVHQFAAEHRGAIFPSRFTKMKKDASAQGQEPWHRKTLTWL